MPDRFDYEPPAIEADRHAETTHSVSAAAHCRSVLGFTPQIDLALLWQFFDEKFPTVRTLPGWRACEEIEDGLPDGRHARL